MENSFLLNVMKDQNCVFLKNQLSLTIRSKYFHIFKVLLLAIVKKKIKTKKKKKK